MKKSIVFVLSLFLITTTVDAQSGSFILKGGVNLANISVANNGSVDNAKQLTSFNAGFAVDVPLVQGLFLQPGLVFTGKGSKTETGQPNAVNYVRTSSNPKYIEIPLNLVAKIPLGGDAGIVFGAGPYAAVGIAGKNKVEAPGIGYSRESNIKYSNDDPTTAQEEGAGYGKLKRFDYGLNGLAGIDFGKIILSANYGLGFAKINSGTNNRDNDNNKHRVVSVNLGIKL